MKMLDCILLIEDDYLTNIYNKKIIENVHVTRHIEVVEDGLQGLNYLMHQGKFAEREVATPDLILLDINMPKLNGWEFVEEYRKLNGSRRKDMKIVFLTSSPNPDDMKRAQQIPEIAGFEKKPLTKERVVSLVKQYFGE
jgi:CheY-like chemotaxis protein